MFGGNPGAIEAQEANGQRELVNSSQLPAKGDRNVDVKAQYEKMGIKVIGETKGDDLFLDVELPSGWKLQPTEHSMHSHLIDDLGRKRAGIFYKAAFYDRKADVNFDARIHFGVNRLLFHEGDYSFDENGEYKAYKSPFVGRVVDFDGKVLFETEHFKCDVEYVKNGFGRGYSEEYKSASNKIESELRIQCLQFLTINYPNYQDVNAYWDLKI